MALFWVDLGKRIQDMKAKALQLFRERNATRNAEDLKCQSARVKATLPRNTTSLPRWKLETPLTSFEVSDLCGL